MREMRKKIWIDRFQTYLALRIAFFFIFYQVIVWAIVFLERNIIATLRAILGQGATVYGAFFFLAAIVVMVGFLFIYDAMKFVHRIVGPIYRFRKTIQAILAGEEVRLVTLRQGDYLQDLKEEFNEMLKLLEQRGAVVVKSTEATKAQGQPLSV